MQDWRQTPREEERQIEQRAGGQASDAQAVHSPWRTTNVDRQKGVGGGGLGGRNSVDAADNVGGARGGDDVAALQAAGAAGTRVDRGGKVGHARARGGGARNAGQDDGGDERREELEAGTCRTAKEPIAHVARFRLFPQEGCSVCIEVQVSKGSGGIAAFVRCEDAS